MKVARILLLTGLLAGYLLLTLGSPISVGTVSVRADFRILRPIGYRKIKKTHIVCGGGGGGGGGGHGSGGTGGHSGSGGSHGSEGGESSPGSSSTHSDSGGRTSSGSGTPRQLGGHYYGGSTVPYRAGLVSPLGLAPFVIIPFALWMPIYWGPYGAFYYRVNYTAPALPNNTAHNTTDPVLCICENYHPCGCDNANQTYQLPSGLLYAAINGTEYAIVNGTLANGTTAPGAASSGAGLGLYLTRSGRWATWTVLAVAITLAFQAL